jgi:hypothetical protein
MSKASDLARLLNADGEIQAADIEDGVVTAAKLASTLDLSGKTITNMNPSGIYLGGTGAANYLDDYEEGTWTPAYSTSGGSFTYDAATQGQYTKIGNVVTLYFRIYTASATVGSGTVSITGLPFASVIPSGSGAGSIGDCRLFAGDNPDTLVVSASVLVPYYRTSASGANAALQASDLNTGATKNLIDGQITYITS